jgi:hypothetical protein
LTLAEHDNFTSWSDKYHRERANRDFVGSVSEQINLYEMTGDQRYLIDTENKTGAFNLIADARLNPDIDADELQKMTEMATGNEATRRHDLQMISAIVMAEDGSLSLGDLVPAEQADGRVGLKNGLELLNDSDVKHLAGVINRKERERAEENDWQAEAHMFSSLMRLDSREEYDRALNQFVVNNRIGGQRAVQWSKYYEDRDKIVGGPFGQAMNQLYDYYDPLIRSAEKTARDTDRGVSLTDGTWEDVMDLRMQFYNAQERVADLAAAGIQTDTQKQLEQIMKPLFTERVQQTINEAVSATKEADRIRKSIGSIESIFGLTREEAEAAGKPGALRQIQRRTERKEKEMTELLDEAISKQTEAIQLIKQRHASGGMNRLYGPFVKNADPDVIQEVLGFVPTAAEQGDPYFLEFGIRPEPEMWNNIPSYMHPVHGRIALGKGTWWKVRTDKNGQLFTFQLYRGEEHLLREEPE